MSDERIEVLKDEWAQMMTFRTHNIELATELADCQWRAEEAEQKRIVEARLAEAMIDAKRKAETERDALAVLCDALRGALEALHDFVGDAITANVRVMGLVYAARSLDAPRAEKIAAAQRKVCDIIEQYGKYRGVRQAEDQWFEVRNALVELRKAESENS